VKKPGALIKKRVNKADFTQFLTEFIALIRAGLTVPEAMEQCSVRPANPGLAEALKSSLNAVREGAYLSDALAGHGDIFDSIMISSVKTGEMAGDISAPLEKYRMFLERRNALNNKISQALVYPVFILSAMLLILTVLFIFVMPRFTAIYADFDAELPGPTKFVFFIAENAKIMIPAFILSCIALYAGYKAAGKTGPVKRVVDSAVFKLPVFGHIAETSECAALARTLHTLLAGGMTLVEALEKAAESVKNSSYLMRLNRVIALVFAGTGFSAAAASEKLMPSTAIKLIEAGEASGTMPQMMNDVASYYEQAIENRITALMTIIEPALILLTGILVGGIIVIMYLPVFQLTEIIK
jgi:type IV pilus assembly protein PilC